MIVAVAGDVCTTTTVAIASAWQAGDDVVVIEADPTGGDLGAWFDLPLDPSLSTVVTRVSEGTWPEIDRFTRIADVGVRVIPAPVRAGEAQQAIAEAARGVVPTLAAIRMPIVLADTGRVQPTPTFHPFVAAATVTVVVHRQATQSARAAAARLQRFVEQLEALAGTMANVVVAVVGAAPFDLGEIEAFVGESVGAVPVVGLPVDELTAAVYGGRTGVSPRRLARLPLTKAARALAVTTERALHIQPSTSWRAVR